MSDMSGGIFERVTTYRDAIGLITASLRLSPGRQPGGPKYRGKHAGENAIKPTHDALLERFSQPFPNALIQVADESHLHVGHAGAAGGTGHFRVRVIDARFTGLQHIARHRLVYAVVSDWIPARVHALNIIAMTLEEAGQASTIQQGASK